MLTSVYFCPNPSNSLSKVLYPPFTKEIMEVEEGEGLKRGSPYVLSRYGKRPWNYCRRVVNSY
jgi:hypothetical protein